MDIVFNATEAEKLVKQMYEFCEKIEDHGIKILDQLSCSYQWDDTKKKEFSEYTSDICAGLVDIIKLQKDYADTFAVKIKTLEE